MSTKTPRTTNRNRILNRIFYGTPSTKANDTNKRTNNTEVINKNHMTNKNDSVKITVNPVNKYNGGKPKKSRKSRKTRKNRKSKRKL
jgi:hypothetical protein